MIIREALEKRELETLSPYATMSSNSKGRVRPEELCDIRPCFQRDRDRILYSKSFRRLKDKTQVFLTPDGDHYRTRMTHTLEVAQNARTIARALRLNEDLTEAIALAHDLGHTPFGHAGERALSNVCPLGFKHNEQSLRTVEILEKNGKGLNLTWEVRDGILNHELDLMPATLEGKIVRLSDKIAYIHHDMDDAIRGRILSESDVPESICKVVGRSIHEWLDTFIHDIVENSYGENDIKMSEEVGEAMLNLRKFMFSHVYTNPVAKSEEGKAVDLVRTLYEYYLKHEDLFPMYLLRLIENGEPKERITCDYVASMTDRFAIARYQDLFIPKSWSVY
ncbi:deoxyguanosinetriphosphate triphosphohydrolase [Butyrivibrio sp. NC3005]|uniref:deoxyguanosinetriphosphate triphosphohydrolase n=1 Tax=Butyrivibrio sp. NC3005 TaxID=1280685 RepID=UPI0004083845|nr:deoxyguanosinetriphosphate triphosphohydrolase [Butyrivibrio sp. NC3005]